MQKFCHGKYNAVAFLTIKISKWVSIRWLSTYSRAASFLQKCQSWTQVTEIFLSTYSVAISKSHTIMEVFNIIHNSWILTLNYLINEYSFIRLQLSKLGAQHCNLIKEYSFIRYLRVAKKPVNKKRDLKKKQCVTLFTP